MVPDPVHIYSPVILVPIRQVPALSDVMFSSYHRAQSIHSSELACPTRLNSIDLSLRPCESLEAVGKLVAVKELALLGLHWSERRAGCPSYVAASRV